MFLNEIFKRTNASITEGGNLAVGREATESEEDAGEHAEGQRINRDGGNQQPDEAKENANRELAGEQEAEQVADRVAQHQHEREERDRAGAREEHAFENVAVEEIHAKGRTVIADGPAADKAVREGSRVE